MLLSSQEVTEEIKEEKQTNKQTKNVKISDSKITTQKLQDVVKAVL